MRKSLLLFGLPLVLVLLGLVIYGFVRHSLLRDLAAARAAVGTRQGGELLERLTRNHPDHPELLFLHARQLRLEGKNAPALAGLRRAAERGWPQAQVDRELLLVRGQIEFRKVEPELQAILNANPEDRDVLLALAFGWSRQQHLEKAEALVTSVLAGDPGDGAALCIRGAIRLQKHQPHDARPDLEEALSRGVDQYYYGDAELLLATCLLEVGQFDEALRYFRQRQADEPSNPKVLFGIGRCAWYLDHWQEACEALKEVLRLQPDHLDALSQLAYIHEERGELTQALELLDRALKSDPTWYDLHFRMAKIHRVLGQAERAEEHLKSAEIVKKHWAKPRSDHSRTASSYTGEDAAHPRTGERGGSVP